MTQDMDKTITALLEALKFSPNNIRLKKHVAELLQQAGRIDEAIEQWKEIFVSNVAGLNDTLKSHGQCRTIPWFHHG